MEKPNYRFFLVLGLILVFAIITSFILAYAFIYVIANYEILPLILAFLVLVVLWSLSKKYRKKEEKVSQ